MRSNLAPFPREKFLTFCSNLKILSKDFGAIPLKLLGSQQYILDEICKGNAEGICSFVCLKARQLGSSTLFMALDLFWAFEHKGLSGAIVTHTEQLRDQFKQMLNVYMANLPRKWKVPKQTHNRNMLTFENQSVLQYLVAGTKESSKGILGTGAGLNFLHKSEESAYGNEDDLKNLEAACSSLYPHRLYINETTARGYNHFADTWKSASDSNTTRVIFVPWWRNELFSFDEDSIEFQSHITGSYHVDERRHIREVRDQFNIEITPKQMAWYRWKLEDKFQGDQSKMDEDFPWTPDHAFQQTGSRFFTNVAITDQTRRARGLQVMPFAYQLGFDWRDTKLLNVPVKRAGLKIWEEVKPHGHYAVGVDPAYGSSDTSDRCAISVVRCFADRCIQVAEFCSSVPSTHQQAWILAHICGYFKNVRLSMEIQGPGQSLDSELKKLRQEMSQMFATDDGSLVNVLNNMRVFFYRRGDMLNSSVLYQFKSSPEHKARMMNRLKDSIELDRCIVSSTAALEECATIARDEGHIEAPSGKHDDRAIALGLANFAWLETEQKRMRNLGMTYAHAMELDKGNEGGLAKEKMLLNYIEQMKMSPDRPMHVPFVRS